MPSGWKTCSEAPIRAFALTMANAASIAHMRTITSRFLFIFSPLEFTELNVLTTLVVELKVNLHCKACEMSTRKVLSKLKGVTCVDIDVVSNKVMVMGYVDQKAVIKAVQKTGRRAEVRPSRRDSKILKMRSPEIASRYGYHASPSRVSMRMHRASPSSLPKPSEEKQIPKQIPKALRRIQHMLCMRPRRSDEDLVYCRFPSKLRFQQGRTSCDFGQPTSQMS
ncbi:hypothetical protein J5N97_026419 [Dioscorea zingiberensis]|uniref:HMA domain-containing protein n=1 Tax=Dioscorea zingiberensis TaxID=325984 RepID=A0A9D5H6N3_9LILI|nr:hypothetical protein J5N97_026419 [Dioscorea zingiberensis]